MFVTGCLERVKFYQNFRDKLETYHFALDSSNKERKIKVGMQILTNAYILLEQKLNRFKKSNITGRKYSIFRTTLSLL